MLTGNLVSYWKFDENTGTSVSDVVGGNTGTWQGTTGSQWKTGIINSGGNFNGTNNYVSIADNASLDFERTNAFSIVAWVKYSTTATMEIVTKTPANAQDNGYFLRVLGGTEITVYLISNLGTNNYINVTTGITQLNNGAWHHVVMTYDGSSSASGVKVYIDGASKTLTTNKDALTASILTTAPFDIGAHGPAGGSYFVGAIDEVGVWSRTLSGNEISQLYNGGVGMQYPFVAMTFSGALNLSGSGI